jgi:hypothetical protein
MVRNFAASFEARLKASEAIGNLALARTDVFTMEHMEQ